MPTRFKVLALALSVLACVSMAPGQGMSDAAEDWKRAADRWVNRVAAVSIELTNYLTAGAPERLDPSYVIRLEDLPTSISSEVVALRADYFSVVDSAMLHAESAASALRTRQDLAKLNQIQSRITSVTTGQGLLNAIYGGVSVEMFSFRDDIFRLWRNETSQWDMW